MTFTKRFFQSKYYLGILVDKQWYAKEDEIKSSIRWVKCFHRNWYADPFILSSSRRKIELLVEEFVEKEQKGRISWIEIAKFFKWFYISKKKVILDTSTHLSFPFVINENGCIFVLPENSQSGKLTLYEYDKNTKALIHPLDLLTESLLDCVIFKWENFYYIIGTRPEDNNLCYRIYYSLSLFGPFSFLQSIINNNPEARSAGTIFYDEKYGLIRPVQNCKEEYGGGIIFKKLLTQVKEGIPYFIEGEIVNCFSRDLSVKYLRKLHTFNSYHNKDIDLSVVDGFWWRYPNIVSFIRFTKKIVKYWSTNG